MPVAAYVFLLMSPYIDAEATCASKLSARSTCGTGATADRYSTNQHTRRCHRCAAVAEHEISWRGGSVFPDGRQFAIVRWLVSKPNCAGTGIPLPQMGYASASICNQRHPRKPMNRDVVTNHLMCGLRFLFLRKAFDNLLSGPDRTRGSKFEEFVSEQSGHFVWGTADFGTLKFHFQLAQQGALLIKLHPWSPLRRQHCRRPRATITRSAPFSNLRLR